MAASGSTASNGYSNGSASPEVLSLQEASSLDAARLSGAGGPTYVIIFLQQLQESLDRASDHEISELSKAIQDNLRNLWAPASSSDSSGIANLCAGRPCRSLLCRIYVSLFTRLDGTGLHDAAGNWSRLALSATTLPEARITAFHLTAAILTSMGHTVPILAHEALAGTIRVFRTNSLPYRLRYAASMMAASALTCCGSSLPLSEARDLCKQLRACLSDKSSVVQKGAAECLTRLFDACFSLHNVPDIDQILLLSFKAQEQTDWQARQLHAHLCSSLLLLTQVSRVSLADVSTDDQATATTSERKNSVDRPALSGQAREKSAGRTLLSAKSMMQRLTDAYNKSSNTSKGRNTIIQAMSLLFTRLGSAYLCENIQDIWECLVANLVDGPQSKTSDQQSHIAQAYITFIIGRLVCQHILHEPEQADMLRYFVERCTSHSIVVPGKPDQPLIMLRMSLKQVHNLLRSFGQSAVDEGLQLQTTLVSLCTHADSLTRKHAQACLTAFVGSAPSQLPSLIVTAMESLESLILVQQEKGDAQRTNQDELARHAGALSSLISALSMFPMYASSEVCTRAMSIASQLLKIAGDRDLHVSTLIITSAWSILEAILGLPRRLVNVHLPQILLLWKNALPKASHREGALAENRTLQEWIFLLSIRQAVLQSINSLLKSYNGIRDEGDLIRRIIALLNHATAFNASVPSFKCQPDDSAQIAQINKLERCQSDFLAALMDAFLVVAHHPLLEPSRANLCNICIAQLTRRENSVASIQTSLHYPPTSGFWESPICLPGFTRDSEGEAFDTVSPIFGMERNLAFQEYLIEELPRVADVQQGQPVSHRSEEANVASAKRATLLDASARLFASIFPLVSTGNQTQYIQALNERLQNIPSTHNRQEKAISVLLVTTLACVALLARSMAENRKVVNAVEESLLTRMRDLLLIGLVHSDSTLRKICSRGIASLCVLGSSSFLSTQIQATVALIVTNTDPSVRSGCVQLFAQIYSAVGAISARPALKTVVDITMTLAADPHPTVHYWSLRALTAIIDTAGLDFTPYVSSCIGLVSKISAADSHDSEGGTLATSTLRGDLPVRQATCAVVDCVISAAGPGLYETSNTAQAVSALVQGFLFDEDVRVIVQAGSALQHLLLVSPSHIITPHLTAILVNQLHAPVLAIQISSVNSIYQIVRRDVLGISKLGGDKLVERLFTILDAAPSVSGVKQTITTWMLQTATVNPAGWLAVCQKVLSQETSNWQVADKQTVKAAVEDEEAQGLRGVAGDSVRAVNQGFLARWPTRAFALTCITILLKQLCDCTGQRHPTGVTAARNANSAIRKLHPKIPDLVRMALLSSTSSNLELKVQGLYLLQHVIIAFRGEVEAQFEDAPILEQYQASIIAAAAPAFEPSAEPEVLIAALKLCGHFVASRISGQASDSSRALRLLEGCLERSAYPLESHVAPAAITAVQVACGAAWARVCVAALQSTMLEGAVKARATMLLPVWHGILTTSAPDPEAIGRADARNSVSNDVLSEEEATSLDLESWLLVVKAWTILSSHASDPSTFDGNFWSLLGHVSRCVDRHLLAETLQSSSYDIAALIIDCLSSVLKLAASTQTYQHDAGTWHELLQIAYRLYLLGVDAVDKQLIILVAALAACVRGETESSEKQAHLQACIQIELLICDRGLREGTETGIASAGSSWMAINAICIHSDPSYHSAMLTAPWALLQRHAPSFQVATFPVSMVSALQQAASFIAQYQLDANHEGLYPYDNIVAGYAEAFQRSLSGQETTTANAPCIYLQILTILAGVAVIRSGAAQEDLLNVLHKCVNLAWGSRDAMIIQCGLLLAKSLTRSSDEGIGSTALSAAHVLSDIVSMLRTMQPDISQSNSLPHKAVMSILDSVAGSRLLCRGLLLDIYTWLLKEMHDSSCDGTDLNRAVVNMIHRSRLGFKRAYANLPPDRQISLQDALGLMGRGGDADIQTREAQPTIELKLFS